MNWLTIILNLLPLALTKAGVVIHDVSTHQNIQAAKDILTATAAGVAASSPVHAQAAVDAAIAAGQVIDTVAGAIKSVSADVNGTASTASTSTVSSAVKAGPGLASTVAA